MKRKKLAMNTLSSIVYQFTAILCGFVLPRLILSFYGSDVNGLVLSVTQFLQIIALLDFGVATVVRSALYKPLLERNQDEISRIISSAGKFFRRIAGILAIYIVLLTIFYPMLKKTDEDWWYTASLILAMGISSFAQYYFGIVNQLLLTADQKGYIQYNLQTVTVIANTVVCSALICFGASIQLVKLTTSLIFLLRPLYLKWYVDHHYQLNRKITYTEEPIKQKWNGLAQHLAAVVLESTDTIVLTAFATYADVSVYGVYYLVIHGVKQMFQIISASIQAHLGSLYVGQNQELLRQEFSRIEWVIHMIAVFLFGCTATLIVPFVQVYTEGVSDYNYIVPVFAAVLTLAHGMHCLRLPYHSMILAAGHFKQTQSNYVIAMVGNIVISIITVKQFGLIGVAVGTLVSMLYQTVWMAWYTDTKILNRKKHIFYKQIFIDGLIIAVGVFTVRNMQLTSVDYLSWVILACKHAVIWLVVCILVLAVFQRQRMLQIWKSIRRRK